MEGKEQDLGIRIVGQLQHWLSVTPRAFLTQLFNLTSLGSHFGFLFEGSSIQIPYSGEGNYTYMVMCGVSPPGWPRASLTVEGRSQGTFLGGQREPP